MKISIVIPVYNADKYIRRCLESILNQDIDKIEIICIDDGSTDDSLIILKEYELRYPFIHVLVQENKYAGVARNAGLQIAKGKYVHFLDVDDFILANSYQKVYNSAILFDADYIKTKAKTFDFQTEKKGENAFYSLNSLPINIFNKIVSFKDCSRAFLETSPAPWTGMVKRSYLNKYNMRFNGLKCVNDRSFYASIISHTERMVISSDFMVCHQINNPESLVGIRNKNFICHLQSYQITVESLNDILPEIKEKILAAEILDFMHWYKKLTLREKQENKKIVQDFLFQIGESEIDIS